MPKVSEEHLEARRAQILDAAARCFARQGFHGTSMQDIFQEAGLSAGAVYRYFPGKAEIVKAISVTKREVIAGYLTDLAEAPELPPLAEIVRGFADLIQKTFAADGQLALVPQAWAAASHDPEIHGPVSVMLTAIRQSWIDIARRLQAEGQLAKEADPEHVGRTLFCLLPGFIVQNTILDDFPADVLVSGLVGLRAPAPD
ncbi:TetR/AcrR family transcriptional regulator [Actinocorallia sp. API 0066]|uniref:TetR/AcrR family transcriptional regulator n=1 Tax=Actinocorallia sp. API 0066 TaxID=2896846 RepID=UPI001E3B216B|nr:TetR/AcrR family transcriptional regulator [Actinocorallia sp. API 0066]MCD0448892.1 TetR/AcrR family transcriptional regulator [Actinocorallia sp. API 0066]